MDYVEVLTETEINSLKGYLRLPYNDSVGKEIAQENWKENILQSIHLNI